MKTSEIITPAYITDTEVFEDNFKSIGTLKNLMYPKNRQSVSFKTNYHPAFLVKAKELGVMAEVVSPKEYAMAASLGYDDNEIIYNGVIPDLSNKMRVAKNGGIVNLESISEIEDMRKACEEIGIKVKIGVRLNIGAVHGSVSRFGIDVCSDDYTRLKELNGGSIEINCVHCHVSQARGLEDFSMRVREMAKHAKELGAKIIDIGGNRYGKMTKPFKMQFNGHIPTQDTYMETICTEMYKCFPNGDVMLVTEDGTPVFSNAMHLLATVIGKKKICGRTYIVVDTKREDVGASCAVKSPDCINISGPHADFLENAQIDGCSCVELDHIVRDYRGAAEIGDKILFLNVGAYSNNFSCGFISDSPQYIDCKDIEDWGFVKKFINSRY